MRNRRMGMLLVMMSMLTVLSCTLVSDGLRSGVTDGFSSVAQSFVEDIGAAVLDNLVPGDGA